jgi:hypothetical protein
MCINKGHTALFDLVFTSFFGVVVICGHGMWSCVVMLCGHAFVTVNVHQ